MCFAIDAGQVDNVGNAEKGGYLKLRTWRESAPKGLNT